MGNHNKRKHECHDGFKSYLPSNEVLIRHRNRQALLNAHEVAGGVIVSP